jgi:hypothetical protein
MMCWYELGDVGEVGVLFMRQVLQCSYTVLADAWYLIPFLEYQWVQNHIRIPWALHIMTFHSGLFVVGQFLIKDLC